MSTKALKEFISVVENLKKEDYELFLLLKNHLEQLNDLTYK